MAYFIAFLLGFVLATAAAGIWYVLNRDTIEKNRQQIVALSDKLSRDRAALAEQSAALEAHRAEIWKQSAAVDAHRNEVSQNAAVFDSRKVQYDSLVRENDGLKQDLFNLSLQVRKSERDHAATLRTQAEIDTKAQAIADRYLNETVSWTAGRINANNYASCKKQLVDATNRCRDLGFVVTTEREAELVQRLKDIYEDAVRKEFARQEQARIKAQIREEERVRKEMEKRIADAEREKAAVQAALDVALARANHQHSAEIDILTMKLHEAEAKAERAKSQAQLTKAGHVYVISNIGSFGDNVFKIGMTRRLEPIDRVHELGDASVPFPFDVHMMISCDDAPSLENALHRELHKRRINKVNFRKEFFRVDLETIRQITEERHGKVEYVADPDAIQYRESASMKDEDFEFIAAAMDNLTDEDPAVLDEP